MQVPTVTQQIKPQPSFGVLRGYKKTPYGEYMWGVLRDQRIEIYDAHKYDQKLIYVSCDKTWRWIKSKFSYVQNGVKRVVRSSSNYFE